MHGEGRGTNNPAAINRLGRGRGRGDCGISDISASIIPTGRKEGGREGVRELAVAKGGKKASHFGNVIGGAAETAAKSSSLHCRVV